MKRFVVSIALLASLGAVPALAQASDGEPRLGNPDDHAYPLLGADAERKVPVAWNRIYDSAGLEAILSQLHAAFPELTRLYSIGKSVEGRDIWCLEVSARNAGDPRRKPGMYIDGNIHGNEVQGAEAVAYTAWYLCHQYGRLEKVTELLDRRVFYLIPTINPDGRDRWLHGAQTPHSSRTGAAPIDNDRDGMIDEDDADDLDGDGSIAQMRLRDPDGRWKPHPDYPEFLMIRAAPDERGEYTLLGDEGIDNDGDGRVNEDPVGGYDPNRNWAWDWQPNYIQHGAHEYPFSLPETRAVAEFVIAHPNIAAMQSYHNWGGMILRGPGREGGEMQPADERTLRFIAERGEKMLPFYDSRVVWKDLYTLWGGEFDWFYGARGILSFTNEMWTMKNLYRENRHPSREDEAFFVRHLLMGDAAVKWKTYDHPTYGEIEIGGTKKQWGRVPPSFLLEEECHRNMAMTLYHADMMPMLAIREIATEKMGEGLYRVTVTIENRRMMPTRSAQDVKHNITPPDAVELSGAGVRVVASARVTDRFFGRAEAGKPPFERVKLETIDGMSSERVRFVVSGSGDFTVTVDSARGGVLREVRRLPQ